MPSPARPAGLFWRIAGGEATADELVAPFALSQPAISKPLKVPAWSRVGAMLSSARYTGVLRHRSAWRLPRFLEDGPEQPVRGFGPAG